MGMGAVTVGGRVVPRKLQANSAALRSRNGRQALGRRPFNDILNYQLQITNYPLPLRHAYLNALSVHRQHECPRLETACLESGLHGRGDLVVPGRGKGQQ